ncbi:MAG: hypothetical protein ACI82F_004196 [Planctomycetota bacterium]|jgi:hypothetical protein
MRALASLIPAATLLLGVFLAGATNTSEIAVVMAS